MGQRIVLRGTGTVQHWYSPGFNIGWRSDVLVRESVFIVSPCAVIDGGLANSGSFSNTMSSNLPSPFLPHSLSS
jgi:hypothetical protein